jgi:sulfotransferase 6B1
MLRMLEHGLHSKNGLVRKGCAFALRAPRKLAQQRSREADFVRMPPVLANSFPKSGTHLLDQIVEALPARRNFGAFLGSHISSFQFRLRSERNTLNYIRGIVPGELVRAHLFHSPRTAQALRERNIVHYFIYRDLRDVVVSEAHYYRSINRWHRLHAAFRDAPSLSDAIMLAIEGVPDPSGRIYYPDIGARFRCYEPWIGSPAVFAVKFEDLTSDSSAAQIKAMMKHYLAFADQSADAEELTRKALCHVAPEKSHTFRQGRKGGWRESFNEAHRDAFKRLAGSILIERGYESNNEW